jgi:hypothetical protein
LGRDKFLAWAPNIKKSRGVEAEGCFLRKKQGNQRTYGMPSLGVMDRHYHFIIFPTLSFFSSLI